jgi:hypothetical protein
MYQQPNSQARSKHICYKKAKSNGEKKKKKHRKCDAHIQIILETGNAQDALVQSDFTSITGYTNLGTTVSDVFKQAALHTGRAQKKKTQVASRPK